MSNCCEQEKTEPCGSCKKKVCDLHGTEVFVGDMYLWKCRECAHLSEEKQNQYLQELLHAIYVDAKANKLVYKADVDVVTGWKCKSCEVVLAPTDTATECWRCGTLICRSCVLDILALFATWTTKTKTESEEMDFPLTLRCKDGDCSEHDGSMNIDDEWCR
jgi:hypothetical protein